MRSLKITNVVRTVIDRTLTQTKPLTRNLIILAMALTVVRVAIAEKACICWDGTATEEGSCAVVEGSCDDFYPGAEYPDAHCYPAELSTINPNMSYVLSANGKATLVNGSVKIPFASDALLTFFKQEHAKYVKAMWKDPKTQAQLRADAQAFRKTDNGMVSPARVQKFVQDTKLKTVTVLPKGAENLRNLTPREASTGMASGR